MSYEAQLKSAEAMLQAGNLQGAERIIRKVLASDAADVNGLMLLGMVEDKRNDYTASLGLMERVLAIDPEYEDAHTLRFYALLHLGRHEEARGALENFERMFPTSKGTRLLRLALKMAPADVKATKGEAAKLRAERGDCYETDIADAAVATAESRYADAYRHARSALRHDPQDAMAHDMAATAAFWSFRPRLARRHAERALKLDPASTGMRGLIRMGRTLWFPPAGFTYACWAGQSMLIGKVGFIGGAVLFYLICKFLIAPVMAFYASTGIPMVFVTCVFASLAYFAFETLVVPKREQERIGGTVALKDY